jgi:hypothetical protein
MRRLAALGPLATLIVLVDPAVPPKLSRHTCPYAQRRDVLVTSIAAGTTTAADIVNVIETGCVLSHHVAGIDAMRFRHVVADSVCGTSNDGGGSPCAPLG